MLFVLFFISSYLNLHLRNLRAKNSKMDQQFCTGLLLHFNKNLWYLIVFYTDQVSLLNVFYGEKHGSEIIETLRREGIWLPMDKSGVDLLFYTGVFMVRLRPRWFDSHRCVGLAYCDLSSIRAIIAILNTFK